MTFSCTRLQMIVADLSIMKEIIFPSQFCWCGLIEVVTSPCKLHYKANKSQGIYGERLNPRHTKQAQLNSILNPADLLILKTHALDILQGRWSKENKNKKMRLNLFSIKTINMDLSFFFTKIVLT